MEIRPFFVDIFFTAQLFYSREMTVSQKSVTQIYCISILNRFAVLQLINIIIPDNIFFDIAIIFFLFFSNLHFLIKIVIFEIDFEVKNLNIGKKVLIN